MTCPKCHKCEPDATFAPNVLKRGSGYCRSCRGKHTREYYSENREELNRRARDLRLKDRAKAIFVSTFYSDKRKGRPHDLDVEVIREMIANGCTYCGDESSKMTVDRIDNSLGHTKDNVVPACLRCNWIRRDMPYSVWMLIAPAIREARLSGALDGWHPGTGNGTKSENRG